MTQAIQYAEVLSNGYLSIPKAITRRLHLKQGVKFKVIEDKGTITLRQIEDDRGDFESILANRKHSKDIEQLVTKAKEKYPDINLDPNLLKDVEQMVEFDEWALNLAKEKGFDRLTEDDVVRIVHECRRI